MAANAADPGDLVDRLSRAATAAIRNERAALTHGGSTLRGLTIELTLASDGQVREAIAYVERRTRQPSVLAGYDGP